MENSRNQWSDLTLTNMIRREGGGRGVETAVAAAVASRTQTEYIIAPSPPYHHTAAAVVSHGNHNSCCLVGWMTDDLHHDRIWVISGKLSTLSSRPFLFWLSLPCVAHTVRNSNKLNWTENFLALLKLLGKFGNCKWGITWWGLTTHKANMGRGVGKAFDPLT